MIDGIATSTSRYITTYNNPAAYINTGNPGSGLMRYLNGSVEVYDGYSWIRLSGGLSHVGLTTEAQEILDWADRTRREELLEKDMLEKYPALKSAKEQYTMIKHLCEAEEKLDNTTQV